jgi:hypothetical protein
MSIMIEVAGVPQKFALQYEGAYLARQARKRSFSSDRSASRGTQPDPYASPTLAHRQLFDALLAADSQALDRLVADGYEIIGPKS